MGLDMYLYAKKYVNNYSFEDKSEDNPYNKVIEAVEAQEIASKDNPSAEVSLTVAYWRKANAIHRWFVQNVQDGEDDCGDYYVSRDNLIELRDLCKQIMDDSSKAMELLPPSDGFFFGNNAVDEWYFEQNQYTYERITNLLEKIPEGGGLSGWEFAYHSSW